MEIYKYDLAKENKIHLFLGISIIENKGTYDFGICLFRISSKDVLATECKILHSKIESSNLLFDLLEHFKGVKFEVEYI